MRRLGVVISTIRTVDLGDVVSIVDYVGERGRETGGWGVGSRVNEGRLKFFLLYEDLRQPGSLDNLAGIESSYL
jgi:hypothetical protein